MSEWVSEWVSVCACVRVRVCVRARACVCVSEWDRERELAINCTPDRETVIILLAGGENFLFPKVSRPNLRPTQTPIQWVPRLFRRWQYSSLGVSLFSHFLLLQSWRKSGAACHSPICLSGAHTVLTLHRSLNAIVVQLKNRTFVI